MNRNLVNVAIVFLALCGLVTRLDALQCRVGFGNKAGDSYSSDRCFSSELACFQSAKCYTVGGTSFKDYTWACMDRSKCSNSKGKSVATYMGAKGTCCFTDNCNANKGPCTDAGAGLTATWITVALAAVLGYTML